MLDREARLAKLLGSACFGNPEAPRPEDVSPPVSVAATTSSRHGDRRGDVLGSLPKQPLAGSSGVGAVPAAPRRVPTVSSAVASTSSRPAVGPISSRGPAVAPTAKAPAPAPKAKATASRSAAARNVAARNAPRNTGPVGSTGSRLHNTTEAYRQSRGTNAKRVQDVGGSTMTDQKRTEVNKARRIAGRDEVEGESSGASASSAAAGASSRRIGGKGVEKCLPLILENLVH